LHFPLSKNRGGACIGEALNLGFGLIEALLKAEDSEVYNYGYEKMRLVQLDVVKHIVGMVELALAGASNSNHLTFDPV
jgi:hypothetical protein